MNLIGSTHKCLRAVHKRCPQSKWRRLSIAGRGPGESSDVKDQTSCYKKLDFSKTMVWKGVSFSQFCANVFYGHQN